MNLLGIDSPESEADVMRKKLMEAGVTDEDFAAAEDSKAGGGLLSPAMQAPKTPGEQAKENYGGLELFGRQLGARFLGGMFKDQALPEYSDANKAQYKSDLALYQKQREARAETEAAQQLLAGINLDDIGLADMAVLNDVGLGDLGQDMMTAKHIGIGGDAEIARAYGYDPAQWNQLGEVAQRGMRNQYRYENGGTEYFDAQLAAEGKSPDQVQDQKSAESFGTKEGGQYGSDRELIMNAETTVLRQDQGLASLGEIKTMLEDPENEGLTGWPRRIRDFANTNRQADGTLSAESASRVIELISQATFGALNTQELQLLKDGVLNPDRSREFNLGTIDSAMKRIKNERERTISSAQKAADRYQGWEQQDDYDNLFKDDWLYNNVGEGSQIQSIPAYGGKDEISYKDYVEYAQSQRGPFDEPLSRDELITGFSELREQSEAEYNAMIEKKKADAEAADRARLGLNRPWPTVAGQE